MNNIQKSFKQKAKCGLRAFAGGGLLDSFNKRQQELDTAVGNGGGYNALPDTPSVAQAMAEGAANSGIPQATAQSTLDGIVGNSNLSGRQKARAAMALNTDGALDTSGIRGLSANQNAALTVDQFNADAGVKRRGLRNDMLAFAGGGTVDPVEQMLANMKNKYGVGNQSQPAPAPQPVQQPPTIQGAVQAIRGRQEMLRNFANGGEIEPFVDGAGFIHGTPGVDKVPAQVAETGENILVGDGERIVNQKQNKALEHLAQKATGQPLDDYLEGATGHPVGPKVKRGLRAAVDGMPPGAEEGFNLGEVNARAAKARAIDPTVAPAVQPAAETPKPMMEPLEMPAGQPAQAARGGVRGVFDKGVNAVKEGAAAAKNFVAGGAEAAAKAPLKWYQPSPGIKAIWRMAGAAAENAPRLAAPVMALSGTYDATKGLQHQSERDAEDIDNRGGFLASTLKDAFPGISAAGEKIGNDIARVVTAARGDINPDSGERESVWDALTSTDSKGRGESVRDIYKRNTGAGSLAESTEQKAERAKADAEVKKSSQTSDPRTDAQATSAKLEADPNIRSLRAAGVQGDVGGDDPRLTAKEDMSKGPQMRGIRTIDTLNGKVYAGRDGNGQLNVVSNLGQTAAESEAARAKEAARINADLKRQTETFDKLALERDMKSNNPADRASAAQRMGLRQLDAQIAQANQQNETTRRGQDLVLQGHQLDNQTKLATLTNQRRTARAENILKQLDNEFGPAMLKDDVPNARRQKFESSLRDTLGEVGLDIGDMPPKDMQEFKKAFEMAERMEPSAARQFYMNWIQGRPFVRDFNPHRQVSRAKGDAGKTDAIGLYQTANGWDAYAPSAVDSSFLTGAQDINARRYLDK